MQNHPILFFLIVLLTIGNSTAVYSHDVEGTLGPDSSASDYYQIECYDDGQGAGNAKSLEIEFFTTTNAAPVVSLQVRTDKPVSLTNITDPVNGDNNPSRTVELANIQTNSSANGYYYVTVNKNRYGIQSYHFTYHCIGDGHAGTSTTALQNQ